MTETATANNPTDAKPSTEAPATTLATAGETADGQQQTQPAQTQVPAATEKPVTATQTTDAAATTAAAGAPEKYDFKAPEGSEYDTEILDAFTGAAREANLTQDAAQKLIEKMAPAIAARQADQVQAVHKEWLDASSSDKEFGGEKLAENLGVARKALDTFGSPQLRALLDETGLGNHPEVIRFMFKAGKAISEDRFVSGANAPQKVNPASVLYDKTPKA
jgi:hypothetical protein